MFQIYEEEKLETEHLIRMYENQSHKKNELSKLPYYVDLNGSALRLLPSSHSYYRDAGHWSVKYHFKNNKLFSLSDIKNLNGIELKKISFKKWYEDNKEYL